MVRTCLLLLGSLCPADQTLAIRHHHAYCPTARHPIFDAWRIRPNLTPDQKMGEKLPSLGTDELIPEEPANVDYGQSDRADIQHRREQERDVRGQPKPSLNLPWKCHTSTAWRSSKKKQTCSRTLQCDENPIRTRSRKAPKGS